MALDHSALAELLDALRSGGNDLDFMRRRCSSTNFPVMAKRATPWAQASSVFVSGYDDRDERAPRQRLSEEARSPPERITPRRHRPSRASVARGTEEPEQNLQGRATTLVGACEGLSVELTRARFESNPGHPRLSMPMRGPLHFPRRRLLRRLHPHVAP